MEDESDDGVGMCGEGIEAGGADGEYFEHGTRLPPQPAQGAEDSSLRKAMKIAREVQKEVRRKDPALDTRPRTSRDDPEFMSNFFKASRLHYIGTWKARYQQILDSLPPPPPLPPPLRGSGERVILHIDMDCFFCSVAVRGRPELKGMPVAVCWSNAESDKASHGEISSANYEARKFGIRAGMFIGKAKDLCENLITLPYEFEKYSSTAEAMYREVFHLTPHVQGVSVDEAYADVTEVVAATDPTDQLDRRIRTVAESLRRAVRHATECNASVGSGPNRLLARMATARAKPDGYFHISSDKAIEYLDPLAVRSLPGVGYNTVEKLTKLGVSTVGELRARSRLQLKEHLGQRTGEILFDYARGIDGRKWEARPVRKSVGAQVTWGVRFDDEAQLMRFVEQLAGEVSARLSAALVKARSVQITLLRAVKNAPDSARKGHLGHGICDHLTRSVTLSNFTDDARVLGREAAKMVHDLKVSPDQVRGLGIQAAKLDTDKNSHSASATRKNTLPAPPARSFDPSKAPQWVRAMVKATSPSKASSHSEPAAAHAHATRESDPPVDPPPGGASLCIDKAASGRTPGAGDARHERPADVAEMYVSYYHVDTTAAESPGGKRKRVIDLLQAGQGPSSDDRSRLKRAEEGLCATGGVGPAEGSSSRAGPEVRSRRLSEEPVQPTLECAARALEAAVDSALLLLVTHAGPPELARSAVRMQLEKAGEELRKGLAGHRPGQWHDDEEALVLLDCAFSQLVRLRARHDAVRGRLDGASWPAWVASEWTAVVEGALSTHW